MGGTAKRAIIPASPSVSVRAIGHRRNARSRQHAERVCFIRPEADSYQGSMGR